jgi:hypothetical protein
MFHCDPAHRSCRIWIAVLDIPKVVSIYRVDPEAEATASELRVIKKLNINRLNKTELPQ